MRERRDEGIKGEEEEGIKERKEEREVEKEMEGRKEGRENLVRIGFH